LRPNRLSRARALLLIWYIDDEGYWVLRGRFTAEQGALIQNNLEQAMEEEFQEQKNVPAATSRNEWGEKIPLDPEPIAFHRADALARMAQAYGSGEENTGSGGDRLLVHVHTDIETLKGDGTGAEAELEEFGNVAAETSRRLACDAGVVHWLAGADGSALDIGRKTRSIPPADRCADCDRRGDTFPRERPHAIQYSRSLRLPHHAPYRPQPVAGRENG
jgi:hypothetical protein